MPVRSDSVAARMVMLTGCQDDHHPIRMLASLRFEQGPRMIEPDTKDWTWVLERACAECGFDAGAIDRVDLGAMLRDNAAGWQRVLAAPEATQRPGPAVWSPTEYAVHVRDVHRIFAGRVRLML